MEDDILEKSCVIYLLINLINGKKYVGQTRQKLKKRIWQHKCCKKFCIGKAIQKYGWENFKVTILEECETPENLDAAEIKWIKELNTKAPNGYNLNDGGEGNTGHVVSEKTRKLRSDNNPCKRAVRCLNNMQIFPSVRAAARATGISSDGISAVARGICSSVHGIKFEFVDEKLKKQADLKRPLPLKKVVCCQENGIIYPSIKEASQQTGISAPCILKACSGKCATAGNLHFSFCDEELKKQADLKRPIQHKKPVRCIETKIIYNSAADAARAIGVDKSLITKICKNGKGTAKGYHWEFVQ